MTLFLSIVCFIDIIGCGPSHQAPERLLNLVWTKLPFAASRYGSGPAQRGFLYRTITLSNDRHFPGTDCVHRLHSPKHLLLSWDTRLSLTPQPQAPNDKAECPVTGTGGEQCDGHGCGTCLLLSPPLCQLGGGVPGQPGKSHGDDRRYPWEAQCPLTTWSLV